MSRSNEKARIPQLKQALELMESADDCEAGYYLCWDALLSGEREVLNQILHTGPVYDGNIISKCDRDFLIRLGLAVRCCFKGEQGYTAASYKGYSVFRRGNARPFKVKAGSDA